MPETLTYNEESVRGREIAHVLLVAREQLEKYWKMFCASVRFVSSSDRGSSFKINVDKSRRARRLELDSSATIAAKSIRAKRTIFGDELKWPGGDEVSSMDTSHDFDAWSIFDLHRRSSRQTAAFELSWKYIRKQVHLVFSQERK